jgi:hypothetical protein
MAFHMPSSPFGRVARGSFDANDEAQIQRRLPSGRGSFRERPSPAEIDGFQHCFSTGRDHFAEFPGRGRSGAEVGPKWGRSGPPVGREDRFRRDADVCLQRSEYLLARGVIHEVWRVLA